PNANRPRANSANSLYSVDSVRTATSYGGESSNVGTIDEEVEGEDGVGEDDDGLEGDGGSGEDDGGVRSVIVSTASLGGLGGTDDDRLISTSNLINNNNGGNDNLLQMSAAVVLREIDGRSKKVYICTHAGCGKEFGRHTHLTRHVQSTHAAMKAFRCTFYGCGKRFARADILKKHLKGHLSFGIGTGLAVGVSGRSGGNEDEVTSSLVEVFKESLSAGNGGKLGEVGKEDGTIGAGIVTTKFSSFPSVLGGASGGNGNGETLVVMQSGHQGQPEKQQQSDQAAEQVQVKPFSGFAVPVAQRQYQYQYQQHQQQNQVQVQTIGNNNGSGVLATIPTPDVTPVPSPLSTSPPV
ncbi:hypothetical protein HDU76_011696, partial [Blyttiomyces sp. JEL0837]